MIKVQLAIAGCTVANRFKTALEYLIVTQQRRKRWEEHRRNEFFVHTFFMTNAIFFKPQANVSYFILLM
jgi:hypothetical protein